MRVDLKSQGLRRAVSFLLPFVLVLGGLAWAATWVAGTTSRRWFLRDLDLRSRLAVSSAGESLAQHWRSGNAGRVEGVLAEIARDERIMGAAACNRNLDMVAHTPDYPIQVTCLEIDRGWVWRGGGAISGKVVRLEGGAAFISIVPVVDRQGPLGFAVLAHDMGVIERREAAIGRFILWALLALAVAVAFVTAAVERFTWRRWVSDVRSLLRGELRRPEFRPILADVRELIARISAESDTGIPGGGWTPERLRRVLKVHLHGEKLILVANREPYIHDRGPDGSIRVLHPASGLVTALEPVMRACSGVWIAHGSGSADREVSDRNGRIVVPPGEAGYTLRRVWLTPEEEAGYYYGFSNEGLWPLAHMVHARPQFRVDDFHSYQEVNKRFAAAVVSEAEGDDPIVLVQDYHFSLLPGLLRSRLPRATIITFWHIPWPNAERLGICPWRNDLLEGMLGSSIIGFQTALHCNNFLDSVDRYLEARIDRERQAVVLAGRATLVRPYPISLEWPSHWVREAPPVDECRAQVRAELGLDPAILLGVGIDRLDYTKGIEERLSAVERLLERAPTLHRRFSFVQIAAPSRTAIERYRRLGESVEALASRINERFGTADWRPVLLLRAHHEPPTVYRYYRAADLCYVSSLHDGMNLVAKEFVAARDDERGVLILSRFTGAARELTEALIVNPYDIEQASSALQVALEMPAEEQRERMHAMRVLLAELNVYRWAGRMVVDAARLREREQLSSRLREVTRGNLDSSP